MQLSTFNLNELEGEILGRAVIYCAKQVTWPNHEPVPSTDYADALTAASQLGINLFPTCKDIREKKVWSAHFATMYEAQRAREYFIRFNGKERNIEEIEQFFPAYTEYLHEDIRIAICRCIVKTIITPHTVITLPVGEDK